jgi:hypothetical protein
MLATSTATASCTGLQALVNHMASPVQWILAMMKLLPYYPDDMVCRVDSAAFVLRVCPVSMQAAGM